MTEPQGSVLMVDRDLGFLLALAQELSRRKIALIPSTSVMEARHMLEGLKPAIDILIVNCRMAGVCALASEMRLANENLDLVAIISGNRQCASCRQWMSFVCQDPEPPQGRVVREWGNLVDSWLSTRKKLARLPNPGVPKI